MRPGWRGQTHAGHPGHAEQGRGPPGGLGQSPVIVVTRLVQGLVTTHMMLRLLARPAPAPAPVLPLLVRVGPGLPDRAIVVPVIGRGLLEGLAVGLQHSSVAQSTKSREKVQILFFIPRIFYCCSRLRKHCVAMVGVIINVTYVVLLGYYALTIHPQGQM